MPRVAQDYEITNDGTILRFVFTSAKRSMLEFNYCEEWEEASAKSTEEVNDTSMTEDELDTTRITMTSIQDETLSVRQQVEQIRDPVARDYP